MDLDGKIGWARDNFGDDPRSEIINGWERRLDEIRIGEEFMKFPETKKLRDFIAGEVAAINYQLQNNEGLNDADRTKLFALRRAHSVYLAKFSFDADKEREVLESEVDFSTHISQKRPD